MGPETRLIYIHASTLDSILVHSHISGDPDYPGNVSVQLYIWSSEQFPLLLS